MNPKDLKYTKEHEWIRVQGTEGTVGITDHAKDCLGDVVFVELPKIGAHVTQNESFGEVESVKAVSELYAPASGTVIAINDELIDHPEYINRDPYGTGWIMRIKLRDTSELDGLMNDTAYEQMLKTE